MVEIQVSDGNQDVPQQHEVDPQPPPQVRVPRTHISPAIINMLKTLPLSTILQKNKHIESENEARVLKTLNHVIDPEKYPDTGSETTSLITIDPDDLRRLKIPSFVLSLHDHIYGSLARFLADSEEESKDKTGRRKGNEKISGEELRISKRRCMDGTNHVHRTISKTGKSRPYQT